MNRKYRRSNEFIHSVDWENSVLRLEKDRGMEAAPERKSRRLNIIINRIPTDMAINRFFNKSHGAPKQYYDTYLDGHMGRMNFGKLQSHDGGASYALKLHETATNKRNKAIHSITKIEMKRLVEIAEEEFRENGGAITSVEYKQMNLPPQDRIPEELIPDGLDEKITAVLRNHILNNA